MDINATSYTSTNITSSNTPIQSYTSPTSYILPSSSINPTNSNSYTQTIIYNNRDHLSFPLALIFFIIGVSILILLIVYFVYWRPIPQSPSCSTNNDCGIGQICQLGSCVEILCSSNNDCTTNQSCINSYCTALSCETGNDCPTGSACVFTGFQNITPIGSSNSSIGSCINVGTSCSSNADCFNLSCMNQICVQCLSNTDCPTGQGCFNQACRYPYDGETGPNVINYFSPAQNNGNISAPPGYFCLATNCGTGTNSQNPITCNSSTVCPTTCPYCVNGNCRCTQGQIFENCQHGSDCLSGICSTTDSGTICAPNGGECSFNFNGTGCQGCCSISNPYCVNGKCSNSSLGAMCGSTGLPADMCYNPLSLGAVGTTAMSPNNMGPFCVNGFCQQTPGVLNELCSDNSCVFIEGKVLTCTSVSTPSITQMRCLPGT